MGRAAHPVSRLDGYGRDMRLRAFALVLVFALGAVTSTALAGRSSDAARERRIAASVARVIDGDTLVLRGGVRVRLVQIDAPELSGSECYATQARAALSRLLGARAQVTVLTDPGLDQQDRYGRTLAYVVKGGVNMNLALVRMGAAAPYFFNGDRGRYAASLLSAATSARAAKQGLWGACPGARLDPTRALSTDGNGTSTTTPAPPQTTTAGRSCDPAYPDFCIAPPPPDLNCKDIGRKDFTVLPPDPHRFDGDHDGRGCES
ncbi:MAG: micrococcal nuclease [Gaiellaceae bacterium]|nr:micrococcal nuclease [Gaiellaceae bacterium]